MFLSSNQSWSNHSFIIVTMEKKVGIKEDIVSIKFKRKEPLDICNLSHIRDEAGFAFFQTKLIFRSRTRDFPPSAI